MSNKINLGSHLCGLGTFETFKIENKIQEFKLLTKLNQLDGAYVVIVVPTIDESKRAIFKDNKELYYLQQKDADVLAQYIMIHMNVDLVTIIKGRDQINSLVTGKEKVDYAVYLHKFIASEKNMIKAVLTNNNEYLESFELN